MPTCSETCVFQSNTILGIVDHGFSLDWKSLCSDVLFCEPAGWVIKLVANELSLGGYGTLDSQPHSKQAELCIWQKLLKVSKGIKLVFNTVSIYASLASYYSQIQAFVNFYNFYKFQHILDLKHFSLCPVSLTPGCDAGKASLAGLHFLLTHCLVLGHSTAFVRNF